MSKVLNALAAAAFAAAGVQSAMAQSGSATAGEVSPMNEPDVVGMWVTGNGVIRLELLPGGRYDEARGERKSAYTGRYTIRGSSLHFVDDSGFTAMGTIVYDVLSVGGHSFRKE